MAAALAATTAARVAKPQPCSRGRFLVAGAPLIGVGLPGQPDAVVVQGGGVAIDSGCGLEKARIRATKSGTLVRKRWARFGALRGVRLNVRITPACDAMAASCA
jgi:hypothetical protein